MKKLTILAVTAFVLFSCTPKREGAISTTSSNNTIRLAEAPLISKDSANKMVLSYLNSINYQSNDTDLQSLVIDAGSLRQYLNAVKDTNEMVSIKIMFAHTLDYINSGNRNKVAGYKRNALTIVIAGVNASGNYVLFPGGTAFNKSMPCPTSCPTGNANNALIQ